MRYSPKPATVVFWVILAVTFLVWVLRGIGVLTFIPGWTIWVLILLSIVAGIVQGLRTWR
ncbi:MAG: hypothetical protein OT478_15870 [Cyanobacteria bacterium FC1]|nr:MULTISPECIES: hypothetical protein [unclassified Desertifilum]MDA0211639.1 hypothetical protein [Cyanobacteria bacterium FC1]